MLLGSGVRDLAVLFLHLLATVARLAGPGGARSVVAESVLVKHQLLILNRSRKRSPNLRSADRVVAGLCAVFISPSRLIRSAIVLKPATLLSLHRALIQRKYRRLFSSKRPMKPGPKGIVIRTEMSRCALPVNGGVEYAAEVGAGYRAAVHTDADEATRELVHDDEHPVAPEHDGLASKEVDAP
jgi:hypothetical protein